MTLRVDCPACRGRIELDPDAKEGRVVCPHCGRKFKMASSPEPDPKESARPSSESATSESTTDEYDPDADYAEEEVGATAEAGEPDPDDWGDLSSYETDEETSSESSDDSDLPSLPSKAKSKGQSRKPEKKIVKKTQAEPTPLNTPNPKVLIAGGAGVAVIVVVGLIFGFFGGRQGGPQAGNADTPSGSSLVIDSVAEVGKEPPVPSLFSAANTVNARTPRSRRKADAGPSQDPKTAAGPWSIPADPKPEDQVYRYADNLRIPIEKMHLKENQLEIMGPVLADRGAPFAIFMPAWTETPYKVVSERVKGKPTHVVKETPQPPVPVIDLRTGETAGEFSWKSPSGSTRDSAPMLRTWSGSNRPLTG